jgi:hypothetical protein
LVSYCVGFAWLVGSVFDGLEYIVISEPRDDVQVGVKYFLSSRRPATHQKVYAVTIKSGCLCSRYFLRYFSDFRVAFCLRCFPDFPVFSVNFSFFICHLLL